MRALTEQCSSSAADFLLYFRLHKRNWQFLKSHTAFHFSHNVSNQKITTFFCD